MNEIYRNLAIYIFSACVLFVCLHYFAKFDLENSWFIALGASVLTFTQSKRRWNRK